MTDTGTAGFPLKLRLVPAGLFALTFDPGGAPRFLYTSERWREMLGLPVSDPDVDAATALRLCDSEGVPEFLAMRDDAARCFKWEGCCKVQGRRHWLHIEATAEDRPDGTRVWHGVMTDFTAQKQAEDSLRRILENLPMPVLAADFLDLHQPGEDAKVQLFNKRFLTTFGYTLEDAPTVGHLNDLLFPDEEKSREILDWWRQALQRVEPGSGAVETREARMRCKDGTDRDMIINATLLPGGPVTAFQDITEHKRAEMALQKSHHMMELAAEAAGIGFWEFDLATKQNRWDDKTRELFGIGEQDPTTGWAGCVHPDDLDTTESRAAEAVAKGERYEQEFRIIRPDGAIRNIRSFGMVIKDTNGHPQRLIGVNYDVTKERQAEEKVRRAHQREKESEREHREQLQRKLRTSLAAAAVIHEIKQPLSALLLEGYLALEHLQEDAATAPARAFLRSTVARAEHVVATADKIQSLLHSVQTDHCPVNLADVVRSAVRFTKDFVAARAVKLKVEGLRGKAARVQGDKGQLLVAMTNLVRNACQAVAGREAGDRRVLIGLRRFRDKVELVVGDNGPGLPAQILAKIPLFTTKPEGTGLGLFLIQAVAENHGAKIMAGRSPLGGAELKLVFPALP